MKIDFYIPKDETIPTQLRVKVNEQYDVYYERLAHAFGYRFSFFKFQGVTQEMARAITDEIVLRMIDQSYDHGASWRESKVQGYFENDHEIAITVYFKVRDSG